MRSQFRAIWRLAVAIKFSVFAFIAAAILGLVGMGVSGLALYYAVAFALPARYPALDDARGDWVWPALILIGMFWSVAFLAAGALNLYLVNIAMAAPWRRLVYGLVLWLVAFGLWFAVLGANLPGAR